MIKYKFATVDDIELLTKTRIEVLRAANKLDDSADMSEVEKSSEIYYRKSLADGSHTAILVMDGNIFIGAGGISYYEVMPTYHNPSGKKAYVMNMYTRPEYRRKGIARKTLDLLIKYAKSRGIECISLEATAMGKPLYENYGFTAMKSEMELL
ncbi:MAG: GNAT family N-acetyltransferase [Lachnospiraceae bacterium]|nr:GNAT family N-acetyltransferase [Lachnospiraceae bacterium]